MLEKDNISNIEVFSGFQFNVSSICTAHRILNWLMLNFSIKFFESFCTKSHLVFNKVFIQVIFRLNFQSNCTLKCVHINIKIFVKAYIS